MAEFHDMLQLGLAANRSREKYGNPISNPCIPGTLESEAWEAGYNNDLRAWLHVKAKRYLDIVMPRVGIRR